MNGNNKSLNQIHQITFFEVEAWEKEYLKNQLKEKKLGFELDFSSNVLTDKNYSQAKDSGAIAVFIYSKINQSLLDKMPALRFIATMSTGFDHIDLKACSKKNIVVANVPFYGENTVAEHTFALILALSRKLVESIDRTRQGDFSLDNLRGFDLKGKTIGIIGLGHIGLHVARIAYGFEMKILAYDPHQNPLAKKYAVNFVDLKKLLSQSDIITLHLPLNSQTEHIINKNNIKLIKPGALLVNTARGGLIETESLAIALEKQILAGVALDVLEEEVFIKEEKELLTLPFRSKNDLQTVLANHILLNDRRVIITPHNAFNSQEALTRILETTIANILAFQKGKPINLVK